MEIRCPGCLANLAVDDETYSEKVLLQCPDCLYVFLAKAGEESGEVEADEKSESREVGSPGEATLLTSDYKPESDAREFQWNRPGASITIIEGDRQGVHRKLPEDGLVIGRQGADLIIEDKAISRQHCELEKKGGKWKIKDLGSLNGTFVNGSKIEESELNHLDEFRIGQTRFLFAESGAEEDQFREESESEMDSTRVDDKSVEKEHALPEGTDFYFEFMSGPKKARSVKFEKGKVIIGRGDEADINVDDSGVSRKHAMVEILSRKQIYISDLASQNGIWLNGMRVRNTRLIHGDLVRMGSTVMKFIIQDL